MTSLEEKLDVILSSPDFTVASYLNLALEDENDLAQRMAELALQLQLQTQSCHEDIGRIGAELQAIVPRCNADMGRVGTGLEGLKMDASSLLDSIQVDSENEVSSSLETLSTLHALQANLNRTKEILTAAATWDSTLNSIPPLLAENNLNEAVQALANLENGERALRGMPNPEEREVAIDKVRQQVTSLLQPQLKHALANMNTRIAPLQQCVALYSQLNKMDTLKAEYIKNRPAQIHKMWFDYNPPLENDGTELLKWLPEWFDAVISLIGEERRQALSIFGPELVPEILIKVLRECFRPILGSFQNRLETICSLQGESRGSLEIICSIYEGTLKSLSLVYENVAGTFVDMLESGSIKGNGARYYKELTSIFSSITSPFAPFQKNLKAYEQKQLEVKLFQVKQQSDRAAAATNGLDSLEPAFEGFEQIASDMLSVAESALARFELLKAGYDVADSLSVVENIVTAYADTAQKMVEALSSAILTDEESVATNFDDSQVLSALNFIRAAGTFRKSFGVIESKTVERCKVLSDRMGSYLDSRHEISQGLAHSSSSGRSILLPDSLSPVALDSVIVGSLCAGESEDKVSIARTTLQRISTDTTFGNIYTKAVTKVEDLARSCQSFVFEVFFSVPKYHLKSLPSMKAWKDTATSDEFSYGALPQQYITHVGEHLLAMVQALDPFAEDKAALDLVRGSMERLRDVSLKPWRELLVACGVMGTDNLIRSLADPQEMGQYLSITVTEMEEVTEGEEEEDPKATEFCNAWLDVVGIAVAGLVLERLLKIPSLSEKGTEQLKADLNYLVNVFSALGVKGHPHPLFVHSISVLESDATYSRPANVEVPTHVEKTIRAVEERLHAIRS